MGELAADLRRHLADEPIHARPPTGLERGTKWIKRNPGKSSAAAIVTVALLVISALLLDNVRANRELARTNNGLEAKTAESESRRVMAEEAAKREKEAAERERRRADEVLRLSAFQRLDDLVRDAAVPSDPALVGPP